MSDADTLTSPCPHCGYPSEDSEMCRACGRLMDESFPEQQFAADVLVTKLVQSWQPCRDTEEVLTIKEEPEFCPSWRMYQGNIYNRRR